MKPLFRSTFFIMMFSLIFFSSCERASVETSVVSLQLASDGKVGSASTTLCTTCLKAVAVKVSGAGFTPIEFTQYHANIDQAETQLTREVNLEVPSGADRDIQVLALYRDDANAAPTVYYGNAKATLTSEPATISIVLTKQGALGGSLMGRYLTSSDAGPTGYVDISYVHPSGLKFQMPQSQIINGWFSFFAGASLDLTYTVASEKEPLFAQEKTVSTEGIKRRIANAASGDTGTVGHISRPNKYWVRNNAFPFGSVKETNDLVFGYFAASGVDISTKKVCFDQATSSSLDNTSAGAASGDPTLVYAYGGSHDLSRTVVASGGTDSIPCGSLVGRLSYDADQISVIRNQLNGLGNDNARAIAGAFTYKTVYDSLTTRVKNLKYERTDGKVEYTLRGLPGVFSGTSRVFDGIRLFKKANAANGGYDEITCDESWLLKEKGFTEVENEFELPPTLFTAAPLQNDVKFTLNYNPNATEGYVVCPTSAGQMKGYGGTYLGALGPVTPVSLSMPAPHDYGVRALGATISQTFTIVNTGSSSVYNVMPNITGDMLHFTVQTNGCSSTIIYPGDTCQITVLFLAGNTHSTRYNGRLNLIYKSYASTMTSFTDLTGLTVDP